MPHLGMPQAAVGSAHTCGVQALPGHRLLFFLASSGFPPLPWSTAPWSSEQRTPPCATATVFSRPLPSFFLLPCFFCQVCRQLAAANVLAILGECACFCSGGAFSHISPPPCASIGLELAFTQSRRIQVLRAFRRASLRSMDLETKMEKDPSGSSGKAAYQKYVHQSCTDPV